MNYGAILDSLKNSSASEIEKKIEFAKKQLDSISDGKERTEFLILLDDLKKLKDSKITNSKKPIKGHPGYFHTILRDTGVGKWNEIYFGDDVIEIIFKTQTHGSNRADDNYKVERFANLNKQDLTKINLVRDLIIEAHKSSLGPSD